MRSYDLKTPEVTFSLTLSCERAVTQALRCDMRCGMAAQGSDPPGTWVNQNQAAILPDRTLFTQTNSTKQLSHQALLRKTIFKESIFHKTTFTPNRQLSSHKTSTPSAFGKHILHQAAFAPIKNHHRHQHPKTRPKHHHRHCHDQHQEHHQKTNQIPPKHHQKHHQNTTRHHPKHHITKPKHHQRQNTITKTPQTSGESKCRACQANSKDMLP